MAEAFAKRRGLEAASAGTVPGASVNPAVVQVMKEKGIDISSNTPKLLTTRDNQPRHPRHNHGLLGRGGLPQADARQDAEKAGGLEDRRPEGEDRGRGQEDQGRGGAKGRRPIAVAKTSARGRESREISG